MRTVARLQERMQSFFLTSMGRVVACTSLPSSLEVTISMMSGLPSAVFGSLLDWNFLSTGILTDSESDVQNSHEERPENYKRKILLYVSIGSDWKEMDYSL